MSPLHTLAVTAASLKNNNNNNNALLHDMPTEISTTPPVAPRELVSQTNMTWQKNYAALVEYGKENGHCNVPARCEYSCDLPAVDSEGVRIHYTGKLGRWLHDQRQLFKGNTKKKLRADRAQLLQALVDQGLLLWDAASTHVSTEQDEVIWHKHFAALLEYCREFGTCNVPATATYECTLPPGIAMPWTPLGMPVRYEGRLGKWLNTQRSSKKGNGYKLTPQRAQLLQDLVDQGRLGGC